ncbi:MAG: T9SS type A sorting domain-containing protein [Bacteroidales bacterium]|nr:T9SS type A sorting domain-containing protein [Bacteroidales bacterium]
MPTITSQTCGQVVLEVSAPSAGEVYYWQGTSCGTLTNNSTLYDTVTTSGFRYIRLFVTAGSSWGDCSAIQVDVPTPPAVPSIIVNGNTLSYNTPTPPDTNVVYYWQGSACGYSTSDDSSVYIVTAASTYYLRAYDTIGNCWSDCSSAFVGIKDYYMNASLYPNPSNGLFTVELEEEQDNVVLSVFDLFGRKIYTEKFPSFKKENIELGKLAKGVYMLNLRNQKINVSKAIIIE